MAFGETVECLARNEVQGDLSFELDAMDAVLGHGFHPLKARQRRSIPNLQTVHRHGRIPPTGRHWRSCGQLLSAFLTYFVPIVGLLDTLSD